jgi:hypothetical protein
MVLDGHHLQLGGPPQSRPLFRALPAHVSPIVGTMHLTKVLMDGGSNLTLLYASTLNKMGIP